MLRAALIEFACSISHQQAATGESDANPSRRAEAGVARVAIVPLQAEPNGGLILPRATRRIV